MKDYYQILEVSYSATSEEIKSSYRRLLKKWHPDVNDSQENKLRTQEIIEAYEILGNNETRSRYDKEYQRKQSFSRSQDVEYQYQDADLEQDIYNAQKKAADTVQEFINDFKKRGSRAKSAAWQEAKKQGIALVQIFVFFALVSIILRACS